MASCGDTIVFIEVKTRSSTAYGSPAAAVGAAKQRRIRRLAVLWLRDRGLHAVDLRFDVVAVIGNEIEVTRSAF